MKGNQVHEEMIRLREEKIRLHNQLIELKGNIRVFVRIRPLLNGEKDDVTITDGKPTVMVDPASQLITLYNPRDVRRKTYEFDSVFPPSNDQEEIFQHISPFVQSAIDGYNVCVFAYGVTNSGKTYTMEGTHENPGVNRLALEKIFNTHEPDVRISVTQIYNETVSDLLNSGKILDVKTGESWVTPGVREVTVRTLGDAQEVISKATELRAKNSTKINLLSSRSHCIVTLKIRGNGGSSEGRLHLIDLAGSENVGRSGAIGASLREAQNINKSLSALGDVVHALIEQRQSKSTVHVPFRNSKLTMLLRDSFMGSSKTVMILQVSPSQSDVTETMNSLAFGQRVRTVELGKSVKSKVAPRTISPRE